jgi:fimbrial isopeptide formation D2 family protein/LPXTG-motif cell wall-anchored protein
MKKKIISIVLSVMMCLGASMTAFAADTTAGNGTTATQVTKPATTAEAEKITHTYEAYQIFTGTIQDGLLYDIQWGSAATQEVKEAIWDRLVNDRIVVKDKTGATVASLDKATAGDIAAAIEEHYKDSTKVGFGAELIAKDLAQLTLTNPIAVDKNKQIAGGVTGWYLIVDTTAELVEEYAVYKDRAQLQFAIDGKANIVAKHTNITIDKTVQDVNDSIEVVDPWGDSADYDVNDAVPFKIETKTPYNLTDYTEYRFVIEDDQDEGLDAPTDIVVKVGNDVLVEKTDYEVVLNGNDFNIVFENIRNVAVIGNNTEITVTYKAVLNEKAKAGVKGNENKARVTYKPGTEGEGSTPWDIVIVFTFKPVINKVDANGPLVGATFTLEKLKYDASVEKEKWTVISTQKIEGTQLSTFAFKGIDDGYYRISEIAPAGYNAIEDKYIVVEAEHTGRKLTKLTVKDYVTGDILGSTDEAYKNISLGTFVLTPNDENVTITTDILNEHGVVLPSTGGIGTTIFYIVGGVLVVGAVVLLIVRRKMGTTEEE